MPTVLIPDATYRELAAQAAEQNTTVDILAARLLDTDRIAARQADARDPSEVIAEAVSRIQSRTPDQLLADRNRILDLTPPPRPLPEGKTLFDVVQGTWPGDESDEEIRGALERLS